MLLFGTIIPAVAQDNGGQQPTAQQQLQHIHTPQSIDQELARLTKVLELTPEQQQQVRPLLVEHHDRIQAVFDKNPTASRRSSLPRFTQSATTLIVQIHALLTDHQKELEKEMPHKHHG